MIIGGNSCVGHVHGCGPYVINELKFRSSLILTLRPLETEIWNFDNQSSKIISPVLPDGQYAIGLGLYIVDSDFCKKL